jgi:sulfite exporter TauE/SafE/copper chaperone CopZ
MEYTQNKEYKFHIHGMHCNSCVLMIEDNLRDVAGVASVHANLAKREAVITGDFGGKTEDEVAEFLSGYVKESGYTFSRERQVHNKKLGEFAYAIPIALALIAGFVVLQRAGLVDLIQGDSVGLATAFLIGLVASVSTCLAVVGGLVLSLSANYAKEGDRVKPQAWFHVGRIAGFFVLGGAVGALGSAFQLGANGYFILNLLVGIVMLILGINLLDVFHDAKRFQLTTPKFISRHALAASRAKHVLAPIVTGVATFFLPCGFTQAMQVYALSTGSFFTGAMTMLVFALGTLPMLAILSFGGSGIHNKWYAGIFFKTAGIVVIALALFNIVNALVVKGIIPPLFSL